jgi:hypothetical protein
MDHWDESFNYVITPKSGPLPQMVSLFDAREALLHKLPKKHFRRAHWLRAARGLAMAAETGLSRDIEIAFECIVAALDEEGWMTRSSRPSHSASTPEVTPVDRSK